MKPIKLFLSIIFITALGFSVGGCSPVSKDKVEMNVGVSYADVETQSFQDAIQVFPVNFDDETTLIGVQVGVDRTERTVDMQLETSSSDVEVAERDAEQAAKAYSEVVAYAQAANSEDDATKTAWNARGEQEEAAEGIGSLYDYYSLSMTVKNEDGTLSLIGTRPAGTDSVVTWETGE